MKIIYATDFHGRKNCYEELLDRAVTARAEAIVNGGDLYPLGFDLFAVQREFLEDWLPGYLARCCERGVAFLATLGNMDLRAHDSLFREVMSQAGRAWSLVEQSAELAGLTFIGCAMTTDGPFSLKDRCLRDLPDSSALFGGGNALASDSDGIHHVENWQEHVNSQPCLREHLDTLPAPSDPEKTVYVLHQPPAGVGQGIIGSGADVGSRAVADFLENSGALLSLHGHIHESPFSGGQWRAKLGRTTCVQPGQLSGAECVSVLIDLPELEMELRS